MIPPSRPRATRQEVLTQAAFAVTRSDLITERPVAEFTACPVKVLALRGYYLDSMGQPGENDRGIYDDAMFVMTRDGDHTSFNANVDPSRQYRPGLATLEPGQIVWYRPGPHGHNRPQGPYPAFRQASVAVVHRDGGTGSGKALGSGLFQDSPNRRFWINLHRGGHTTTSSAGCLTIPPNQWDAFRNLIHHYLARYQIKQFPCLLIREDR